jgi:transcriptional regulator of acetoin/glycerol metabolism
MKPVFQPLVPQGGEPSISGSGLDLTDPLHLRTDTIRESHERCLSLGLSPRDHIDFSSEVLADFRLAQERCARLQAHAMPVIEMLLDQVGDNGNIVCLGDDKGTLLIASTRGGAIEFSERVALRPGVSWAESAKGTNAIGTALVTEQDIYVHANEHYFQSNHVLTCAASPIMDHSGSVIGVLDITGDHRSFHAHTLRLVRLAARTIENYWFCDTFTRHLRLYFHKRPELIGTMAGGIIALSHDGRIMGINRAGMNLLNISSAAARMHGVRGIFGTSLGELLDQGRSSNMAPLQMQLPGGETLYVRTEGYEATFGQIFTYSGGKAATPVEPASVRESARVDALTDVTSTSRRASERHQPTLDELGRDDPCVKTVVEQARRVLNKDIPILILGETGTGKEVLSNALHLASHRRDQPFVAVNCASIPESLIESELFGYEDGAFTGAKRKGSAGKLRQAHGGTLFLDEIGDMPLALQARLLRVLQERKVVPLGGHKAQDVDFTLICATHRQLRDQIARGQFREDLYYRINGLAVKLPRLCERSDLRALCQQMIRRFSPGQSLSVSDELMAEFEVFPWPGNLRQLHNVLRTACVMAGTDRQITRVHLSVDFVEDLNKSLQDYRVRTNFSAPASDEKVSFPKAAELQAPQGTLGEALDDLKIQTIRQMLADCDGNVSEAALRLNISRNTIYRKLKAASMVTPISARTGV